MNCTHCHEPILNLPNPKARPNRQDASAVRALAADHTHVLTMGGPLPIQCFLQHMEWARDYVQFELRIVSGAPCLVEVQYPDDSHHGGIFGIWQLLSIPADSPRYRVYPVNSHQDARFVLADIHGTTADSKYFPDQQSANAEAQRLNGGSHA